MSGNFGINETLNTLKAIFETHKNERICVVGTMCCGKTTLLKQLSEYNCIDVDDEFWHQIPKEDIEVLSQTPITKEIIDTICKLMHNKITVKPGFPLFGITILDCEAVVYLDISEQLLEEHCEKRGDTNLDDAIFIKKCVEEDWNNHKMKKEKILYYVTVTE